MFVISLILILICFVIFEINLSSKENFVAYQTWQQYIPLNTYRYPTYIPYFGNPLYYPYWFSNGYTNYPWNNVRIGNTRNMSYDYRGDPVIIPKTNFVWNNGTVFPIYN